MEEGKEITFTAKANDGYQVKGWTLDNNAITEAGTNTEYKLKVSKAVTVKVSFEAIPPTKYTVTLTQTANGKVTASPEIPADGKMAKDTEITFTATANDGYKIGKWTVTPTDALQANTGADGSPTAKVKITADTTVSVSFELNPVEGGAVLILSPDKLTIKVTAKTADGSAITVEGCDWTILVNGIETTLTAKGTRVVLKGKITKLYCNGTYDNKQSLTALNVQGLTSLQGLICWDNQLTELNVQGLTSLQELNCNENQLTALNVQGLTSLRWLSCSENQLTELNVQGLTSLQGLDCYGNQIKAQAMTALLNALPSRTAGDDAWATLYTEKTGITEGNCKDFTQPEDLKKAFDGAKKRKWELKKYNASGIFVEI